MPDAARRPYTAPKYGVGGFGGLGFLPYFIPYIYSYRLPKGSPLSSLIVFILPFRCTYHVLSHLHRIFHYFLSIFPSVQIRNTRFFIFVHIFRTFTFFLPGGCPGAKTAFPEMLDGGVVLAKRSLFRKTSVSPA